MISIFSLQLNIGKQISMSPVSECTNTVCYDMGCSNDLIITEEPLLVNAPQTSLVGVTAYVQAECVCRARNPLPSQTPANQCTDDYCYNGGTCHATWADK